MEKKYEVIAVNDCDTAPYRIRALKDFGDVKKGDLGGFVQSESNLSQEGNCWIYDVSKVLGNSVIKDNAIVRNCSYIRDSNIHDNAIIRSSAIFNSVIRGADAFINNTMMRSSMILDDVKIDECTIENSRISSPVIISTSNIYFSNIICAGEINKSYLKRVVLNGNDFAICTAYIKDARIGDNACIKSSKDVFSIGPLGVRSDQITFYKGTNGDTMVSYGYLNYTIEKFEEEVKETHKGDKYEEEYMMAIEIAKKMLARKADKRIMEW